jgi:hypothetical protein
MAMTRLLSRLSLFLICGTLPVLAAAQAQPAQSTPATAPSSTTPTPSQAASTTPPASSAKPAPSNSPQELTDEEKKLLSKGYHLEVHGGQKTFCRREAELGSHFERKVCGTPEQLGAIRQTSRDLLENSQRNIQPGGH